jgi:hypothetical protein
MLHRHEYQFTSSLLNYSFSSVYVKADLICQNDTDIALEAIIVFMYCIRRHFRNLSTNDLILIYCWLQHIVRSRDRERNIHQCWYNTMPQACETDRITYAPFLAARGVL